LAYFAVVLVGLVVEVALAAWIWAGWTAGAVILGCYWFLLTWQRAAEERGGWHDRSL
jgi:hypothetical protein